MGVWCGCVVCGVWCVVCGVLVCGMWYVVCGVWCVGVWCVVCGVWCVVCEQLPQEGGEDGGVHKLWIICLVPLRHEGRVWDWEGEREGEEVRNSMLNSC